MDKYQDDSSELLQKTREWLQARIGKFTSSEHYRLVADAKRPMTQSELDGRPKGSKATTVIEAHLLADGAITYIEEVLGERLTGQSADGEYMNKEMEWGILHEPMARRMYELVRKCTVRQVGIIEYNPYVAGSPDGLVDPDGGIEIKCPYTNAGHIKNLRMNSWMDLKSQRKEHYWQCISGMLINNRKWWDYVSFSPNFDGALQMKIIRIYQDEVIGDIRLLATKLKSAVKKTIELETELNEAA